MNYRKIAFLFVLTVMPGSILHAAAAQEVAELPRLLTQKTLNGAGAGLSIKLPEGYQGPTYNQEKMQELLQNILKNPEVVAKRNAAYDSDNDEIESQLIKKFDWFENVNPLPLSLGSTFEKSDFDLVVLQLDKAWNDFNSNVSSLQKEGKIIGAQDLLTAVKGHIDALKTLLTPLIGLNVLDDDDTWSDFFNAFPNFYEAIDEAVYANINFGINEKKKREWAQRAEKEANPIWSLEECQHCEDFDRGINRKKDFITEQTRSYALDGVKREKTLRYTSIGSGQLLPDLITLTNLVNAGYDTIHVRLIDLDYKDYINNYKTVDNNNWNNLVFQYQLEQFLAWFNIYLPKLLERDIRVNLDIYNNRKAYEQDYRKKPDMYKNNLIYVIDIGIHWTDQGESVAQDVEFLINETLLPNGWAFLFKDGDFIVKKTCSKTSGAECGQASFSIEEFEGIQRITPKRETSRVGLETWIDPYSPAAPIQSVGRQIKSRFNVSDILGEDFDSMSYLSIESSEERRQEAAVKIQRAFRKKQGKKAVTPIQVLDKAGVKLEDIQSMLKKAVIISK